MVEVSWLYEPYIVPSKFRKIKIFCVWDYNSPYIVILVSSIISGNVISNIHESTVKSFCNARNLCLL